MKDGKTEKNLQSEKRSKGATDLPKVWKTSCVDNFVK
jgi:hypothetical protein